MPSVFDKKIFNSEVFQGYYESLPNPKKTELIKSKALRPRPDLAEAMKDQQGGNYITTVLSGLISNSKAQNYDGETNMDFSSLGTYKHSRVVVGRMNSWVERDFSYDVTGGKEFLEVVAEQIAAYWDEIDQETIICILKGVFNMNKTAANKEFVAKHTYDIVNKNNSEGKLGHMDGTTLNTGMQRACGDNKSKFSLAIMHSMVSTNLENLKILAYAKYTDNAGIQRDIGLGTLNGRLVLIDDGMPTKEVEATYSVTADKEIVSTKTYYTRSGSGTASAPYVYEVVAAPAVENIATYYEMTAEGYTEYTTYALGDGAIEYTDCGAKVPVETDRDPKQHGGEDAIYSRQRKCFAPYGISFTQAYMAKNSPTNEELEKGDNWTLVSTINADTEKVEYISHKVIPIARILSRG